jgi:hypothetical protein
MAPDRDADDAKDKCIVSLRIIRVRIVHIS